MEPSGFTRQVPAATDGVSTARFRLKYVSLICHHEVAVDDQPYFPGAPSRATLAREALDGGGFAEQANGEDLGRGWWRLLSRGTRARCRCPRQRATTRYSQRQHKETRKAEFHRTPHG